MKIFISYTSSDRLWAQWIGVLLREAGHIPFVHEWDLIPGIHIPTWIDKRLQQADRVLVVLSDAYLKSAFSQMELDTAFQLSPFLLPIEVQKVTKWPSLLAPIKRLSIIGLSESEAASALLHFIHGASKPDSAPAFPGRIATSSSSVLAFAQGGELLSEKSHFPASLQLVIIHLTDLHFGSNHQFSPVKPIGDGRLPVAGYPTLLDSLVKELDGPDPGCPVIICITGDFVETGQPSEFRQAEEFIRGLAKARILGKDRGLENIFVVPGNHDLSYGAELPEDRWTAWTNFFNQSFDANLKPRDDNNRVSFHDRVSDIGAIILCLNSAEYVQKDTPEAVRGLVDHEQLNKMKQFLDGVPQEILDKSIRIALIHHHPVLIPALAESEKGYDAIENAGYLLTELRNFGFHLILHGHKHAPYHFSEDSYTALYEENRSPILIVAGGSTGSTQLPEGGQNCYNKLAIKWNHAARQTRIRLSTRVLSTRDENHRQVLPSAWKWVPRLTDDRQYLGGPRAPYPVAASAREFLREKDGNHEKRRKGVYGKLRLNMPTCEVMPSLVAGQSNEVRLWIEVHRPEYQTEEQRPVEVTWSAGPPT